MRFDDELAQEIADRLRKGEVVAVVDIERNHNGRALQILEMTLDDDARATPRCVMLPGKGELRLLSTNVRALEGLRFNLALVGYEALGGGKLVGVLDQNAAKTPGAEVRALLTL